jgi:deazaflavin-dependent oxidoreductase (nitroreductase family)
MPLLLLTTTGARSGKQRATPLTYLDSAGSYVVSGANAGARGNPDWYYNVLANPEVTVEVVDGTFNAIATVPAGAQRAELFQQYAAAYPLLTHYQQMTRREIPMVVLKMRELGKRGGQAEVPEMAGVEE